MEKPKDQTGRSPIPIPINMMLTSMPSRDNAKNSFFQGPIKQCKCGKMASEHFDNGLSCGDDMCDDCFEKMRQQCRQRSW